MEASGELELKIEDPESQYAIFSREGMHLILEGKTVEEVTEEAKELGLEANDICCVEFPGDKVSQKLVYYSKVSAPLREDDVEVEIVEKKD